MATLLFANRARKERVPRSGSSQPSFVVDVGQMVRAICERMGLNQVADDKELKEFRRRQWKS